MIEKANNAEADNTKSMSEEVAKNPGARAAAIDQNPALSLEEARNAAEGKTPNAAGSTSPDEAEDYVPSTSDPNPTNIPTANAPDIEKVREEQNNDQEK